MSREGKDIYEEVFFSGGLDTDSDSKFVAQGDYVDALNVIKVEDSERGVLVNIKGNTGVYINNQGYTEEHLCGWAYYDKNDSVILFLRSRTDGVGDSSSIIEYNPKTETSTTIYRDSTNTVLAFENPLSTDYFIDARIIDDWLAWTDNVNPPRMINIQDVKYNSPTITADYLSVIKKPPFSVPIGYFGYDSNLSTSRVTGAFYKFKYRYVYDGYLKSVWSGSGDISVANVDMSAVSNTNSPKAPNYIFVKFNSGSSLVRFIEIASQTEDIGSWTKQITIDKTNANDVYDTDVTPSLVSTLSDDTDYYYKFTNLKTGEVVDSNDILKPYDNVPLMSESMTFNQDGRLLFGGNTYDYDINDINIDITFSANYATVESKTTVSATLGYANNVTPTSCTVSFKYDLTALFPLGVNTGDIINFHFRGGVTGAGVVGLTQIVSFSYATTTLADIVDYIANKVGVFYTLDGSSQPADSTDIYLDGNYVVFEAVFLGATGSASAVNFDTTYSIVVDNEYSTFSRNSTKNFGIVYYDEYGRKTPVLVGDDCSVEIEDYYEAGNKGRVTIDYVINHTAPLWAKYYRFAYIKDNTPYINVFSLSSSNIVYNSDGEVEAGFGIIDISSYVNNYNSDVNKATFGDFNIEIGDTVKRLYDKNNASIATEPQEYVITDIRTSAYLTSGGSATSGLYLIIQTEDNIYGNPSLSSFEDFYFLLRIKKRITNPSDIYYEVGSFGSCSNGVHSPSSGNIDSGDAWIRWMVVVEPNATVPYKDYYLYKIDSYYPLGNIIPYLSNADRINVLNDTYRNLYENTIVWSGRYIEDTKINGINSFDLISYDGTPTKKIVSENYGKIKGLQELGNVLTVICEEKVLSAYVGATEYTDTAGNVNVVKSTDPIGYLRPHAERYGTFLKESIVNTGKYVYFYDILNGCYVRKAYNGLYPISGDVTTEQGVYSYKMRSFFKALSESLLDSIYTQDSVLFNQSHYVKVYSGYDPYYNNVYITIKDVNNESNNISLIFNEATNRWVSKYSAYVNGESATLYPSTKTKLYHWHNDRLYELYSNSTRCNLYGEQKTSYIQFVTHGAANVNKIFNAMGIESDGIWTVDPIEIDASTSYPNGMYSKIPASNFVVEEGIQKSEFLKNMKTRSSSATNYDLWNGEDLRGKVLKIKMTNSDTDKVELFKVNVNSEISK